MDSHQIKIVLGRENVKVTYFQPELENLEAERVQSSFGHPLSSGELDPHNLFMNGLNHLVSGKPERIQITWNDGKAECTTLYISKEKMTIGHRRARGAKSVELDVQRTYDPGRIAAETKSLHQRAACCPVPVSLDGVLINSEDNPHSWEITQKAR